MGPQSKRRKLNSHGSSKNSTRIEEITFDPVARHEFLTGFHKRKMARMRHAQEVAQKKAREERRLERKKIREERQAEFQRAMEESRRRMKELTGDSDDESVSNSGAEEEEEEEWEGFAEPPPVDYEAEYIDEDKCTTVTVEEMDPSKEGLYRIEQDSDTDTGASAQGEGDEDKGTAETAADSQTPKTGKTDKPKKKKKKFRYETKEERKLTRLKERLSKRRKAEARRRR